MERIQVQLTPAQADRLRELARQRRVSMAALIRQAVDHALQEGPYPLSPSEQWERSRSAVGRYRSGSPSRASEDHDRHLEDIYRS